MRVLSIPPAVVAMRDKQNFDRIVALELTFRSPTRIRLAMTESEWLDSRWVDSLQFIVNAWGVGIRAGTISQRIDGGRVDGSRHLVVQFALDAVRDPPPPERITLLMNGNRREYLIRPSFP